jgi:DNA-binding MarR family transcriptional regulator
MRNAARPLFALLSQVLVAFTVEFDNEFERRMNDAGYNGTTLSMVLWSNLVRFLVEGALSVRDLAFKSLAPEAQVKAQLGCLERWRFIVLQADSQDDRPVPSRVHRLSGRLLRDGWGSGRGIRSGWKVVLTGKGRKASEIWTPLAAEVERRWRERFGDDDIARLREGLEQIVGQADMDLPHGLPGGETAAAYPARTTAGGGPLPLAVLLSQALLLFTVEFDRQSPAPLWLCASTLRVLSDQPTPAAEIPRLTGSSPETSGVGWQIKPYIVVEPDPDGRRGKFIRLSPAGASVQQRYRDLIGEIEKSWEARFGTQTMQRLRYALLDLFVARVGDRPAISEGLVPQEGTVRAGKQAPALGRREAGAAARQRMKDLVTQSEMFQRDPAGTLPHYPLWDMNRGFGP